MLQSGKLKGSAKYVFQAKEPGQLFAAPRLKGNFVVGNGVLLGVDLASQLLSSAGRGQSAFNELGGSFTYEKNGLQLRNVQLNAGLVTAGGYADVSASDNLSGHFVVDLTSGERQGRANLSLSGSVKEPHFSQ